MFRKLNHTNLLLLALLTTLFAACSETPSNQRKLNSVDPETEPVTISIRLGEDTSQTGRYKGTFQDVSYIYLGAGSNYYTLNKNGNIFSGEVNGLVIGSTYDFQANAHGSDGTVLFTGSTNSFTISSGNNFLELRMSPVDDGVIFDLPRITRIYYDQNMQPNTNYPIRFEVAANSGDNITYQVTVDNGTLTNNQGTAQIQTKYTSFNLGYTSPNDNNTSVNFDLSVTNSQNYTITSSFAATISNSVDLEPGIIFNPVVVSLKGERYQNTNSVNWEIVVNDEGQGSNLLADWTYSSGAFQYSQNNLLPTQYAGDNTTFSSNLYYNASENGTLEVRIYNNSAGDNITVTWPVAVNQFPDVIATNSASSGVTRIATGLAHSCVVVDNGTNLKVGDNSSIPGGTNGAIYCWGLNDQHQLGNNNAGTDNQSSPVLVDNVTLTHPVSVTAADNFTCSLDNNSSVACWGTGFPTLTNSGSIVQIDAGGDSLCGVLDNGSLECAGSLSGTPTTGAYQQVSVGGSSSNPIACAVADNGSLECWGNSSNQVIIQYNPLPLDNVSQVSVGDNHACAVLRNNASNNLKCWGVNTFAQLGAGFITATYNHTNAADFSSFDDAESVAFGIAGTKHTCAVRTNGVMSCWGDRSNGKIGNNTDSADNNTTCQNNPNNSPVDCKPSLLGGSYTNATQMALGAEHTCALLVKDASPQQEVRCWGLGEGGRLGRGDNQTRLIP